MIYIIDGNNLAGQLGILFQNDFDKNLIEVIKKYFCTKKMKVYLVFDSNEPMGDKFSEGFIEIIYTPRDTFYQSADDKVLELVAREIDLGAGNNQISVVTDDLDLIEAVEKAARKRNYSLVIIKARDFAEKIKNKNIQDKIIIEDRGIDKEQEEKINRELLKIWREK